MIGVSELVAAEAPFFHLALQRGGHSTVGGQKVHEALDVIDVRLAYPRARRGAAFRVAVAAADVVGRERAVVVRVGLAVLKDVRLHDVVDRERAAEHLFEGRQITRQ